MNPGQSPTPIASRKRLALAGWGTHAVGERRAADLSPRLLDNEGL